MCDVDDEAVVAAVDAPSIYDIPKVLHTEGLDAYVVRRLGLPFRDVDWTSWDELLDRVHRPTHEVTVALVGKYVDLPDAYLSVTEALRAGGFAHDAKVNMRWVASDDCADPGRRGRAQLGRRRRDLRARAGSASAASRASSARSRYAREHGIPTLGLCLGLQCMVIEYARNLAGLDGRQLDRVRPETAAPGHRDDGGAASTSSPASGDLGGTMRLGALPGDAAPRARSCARRTAPTEVDERHRHRYEVNNAYRAAARAEAGLVFSGTSPGRPARRVRRAAARDAPVLRRAPRPTRSSGRARPARTRCSPGCVAAALDRAGRAGSPRRRSSRRPRSPARVDRDGRPIAERPGRRPARPVLVPHACVLAGACGRPRADDVDLPGGEVVDRDVVVHPGAVAVARPRRRRPRAAGPAVPPPGRRTRAGSCRPGCCDVRGRGPARRRARASWPRRPRSRGRHVATLLVDLARSPGLRPRRCGSSSPATSRRCRRATGTSGTDEEAEHEVAPGFRSTTLVEAVLAGRLAQPVAGGRRARGGDVAGPRLGRPAARPTLLAWPRPGH